MELIRTKRATSSAGANGSAGQPKSKYRKRSVSLVDVLSFPQADFDSFRLFGLVSGQLLQANAILVILERHLNGDEVPMEPEHSVMRADCVRSNTGITVCSLRTSRN